MGKGNSSGRMGSWETHGEFGEDRNGGREGGYRDRVQGGEDRREGTPPPTPSAFPLAPRRQG